MKFCIENEPPLINLGNGHCARCWLNLKEMPASLRPAWMKTEQADINQADTNMGKK
jgi:hypothetical protein